ncbi:serine hydrolase [Nitzschia inconspicua]|uniref:Serine hydrolase n=1 Tax=Nitzschia inconspicua TaxID=303405 RepID=A0A9K3LSN9_9STRA|nr:serine hydrolase [Nitzschia inconspicua]
MNSVNPSSNNKSPPMKPRILCLHGRCQSGAMLSNKIAGARKKLQRIYELDFLDGPLVVAEAIPDQNAATEITKLQGQPLEFSELQRQLAWWDKDPKTGKHLNITQAFSYVIETTKGKDYDGILGFSQGGVLAASLVLTGAFPNVKVILTAGSPYVPDAFECAKSVAPNQETIQHGLNVPKLHFAGKTDAMVPVESTARLCEAAGNGNIVLHEKGHLFPTKAAYVNQMMRFLEEAFREE